MSLEKREPRHDNVRVLLKFLTIPCLGIALVGATHSQAQGGESKADKAGWDINFLVFEGYNSNVPSTSDPVGSFYTELDLGLGYVFRTPRTLLEVGLEGGIDYYYSSQLERNFYPQGGGYLDFSYELSPRTKVMLEANAQFLSQPSFFSPGSYQDQGNYFLLSVGGAVEHQWRPRLGTITSWDANFYLYSDPYYQDSLGRVEQILSNQVLFLWKPTTSLVQEYRLNPRTYLQDSSMDSLGQYFLLGADQQLNPRSVVGGRFGLEQRWLGSGNGGDGHYLGPYGEISLGYETGRNNVDLGASYGTQSSGLVGVGESDTFQLSAGISRNLGRKTKVGLTGNYQLNQFDQSPNSSSFQNDVFDVGIGIERKIGKRVSLEVGYRYSGVVSGSNEEGGYNRNVIFLGTKIDL